MFSSFVVFKAVKEKLRRKQKAAEIRRQKCPSSSARSAIVELKSIPFLLLESVLTLEFPSHKECIFCLNERMQPELREGPQAPSRS
jgi:hypothetical protein